MRWFAIRPVGRGGCGIAREGEGLLAVEEDERVVGVLTDRDVALHFADAGRDAALVVAGAVFVQYRRMHAHARLRCDGRGATPAGERLQGFAHPAVGCPLVFSSDDS